MEIQTIQIVAGSISSMLFISGNVPMLLKVYKTKDVRSYSLSNIILLNAGNLIYWLYISSLPLGPIWVLHSFYTVTMALMFVWYLRYAGSHVDFRPSAGGQDAQDR